MTTTIKRLGDALVYTHHAERHDQWRTRRITMAADTVREACVGLPDDQAKLIFWLYEHGVREGLGYDELGEKIGYDKNTLYQVFRGSHSASKNAICEAIAAYKSVAMQRGGKIGFIPTSLSKRMWQVFDSCRVYQKMGCIFGDSQIGKTSAAKEYAARNMHTCYVRLSAIPSLAVAIRAIATTLNVPTSHKADDLKARLVSVLNSEYLLIIDEAHEPLIAGGGISSAIRTFEFIRELHDETGCGVVFLGTNVFREELTTGHYSKVFEQILRRRWTNIQLPDRPAIKDLDAFSAAYGLPAATGEAKKLQDLVIREEALGVWLTVLAMGQTIHRKEKSEAPITWEHVARAYAARRSLEEA